jgi:hypothetical protein
MARAAYMGDLRAWTCALVLLTLPLVGRDGLSSPLPPLPTTYDVSMEPAAWLILYSPGMPANPSRAATGSWYFDFPVGPEAAGVASVHYVTTRPNGAIANATNLRIEFAIDEHGSPTYQFRLKADNNCDPPANFADTDEAGHAFQSEAGHPFRFEAGQGSDVMSATGLCVRAGHIE